MEINGVNLKPKQMGFVVKNLETAIENYEKLFNIGPFVVRNFSPPKFWLKGEPATLSIKLAKCMWGDMELEIIEASQDNPGTLEFVEKHGDALQHLGYYVDDFDACLKHFKEQNIEILHSAQWTNPEGKAMQAAYFDTMEQVGMLTEIMG